MAFSDRIGSFDLPALLEVFEWDHAAIALLLEAALDAIRGNAQEIAAAAGANDGPAVFAAAHHLMGTAGTIGARRLLEVGSRIEKAAGPQPITLGPEVLSELRATVAALDTEICVYIRHHRRPGGV